MAVNSAIKSDAKILNMSLSGPQDALLELLLNKAITDGMIVVAADTGRSQGEANFPASMKNVISVQSTNSTDSDHSASDHTLAAPSEKYSPPQGKRI
jgi:hypothetical protein